MKKLGRNDPCPCGSGKKYKQCCLKVENIRGDSSRSEAVPKAIHWFFAKYGDIAREAFHEGFFGGLLEEEYAIIEDSDFYESIMINAMEWFLAEGIMTLNGQEHRVADLLLGGGGPLFSAEQRQWLQLMTTLPLRLYEIIEVIHGQSMTLRDVLLPERPPVVILEKFESQQVSRYDLMAVRVLPVENHFELSGAVYAFPRNRSENLLEELRDELEGVEPDSALAKEISGLIISDQWLELFVTDVEMPQLIDQVTGESLLFVTDHYRVSDWDALDQALSAEVDIEGGRKQGWSRVFQGNDGLPRRSIRIDVDKGTDRIKVCYCTQKYADEGRPWFEIVAGIAVAFVFREISDPNGMLAN